MLTLTYDSAASARPNTFQVVERMGLYHVTAHIRTTEACETRLVVFWCQCHERGALRRRDPELGVSALLLSRVEEHAFTLESAKLHASLPRLELLLRGWSPAE